MEKKKEQIMFRDNKYKNALVLSVEMWQYFYEHPEIEDKKNSPFFKTIRNVLHNCFLCEYFGGHCNLCPLKKLCVKKGHIIKGLLLINSKNRKREIWEIFFTLKKAESQLINHNYIPY